MTSPTDPQYALQWHLTQLGNMELIWQEFTGAGVAVGVYDDGIEATHTDLDGNYNAALEVLIDPDGPGGNPPVALGPDLQVDDFHGTSVAGLIAAELNGEGTVGVAHGADIASVDIFGSAADVNDYYFSGTGEFDTAIAALWTFDITNHSWGGYDGFSHAGSFSAVILAAYQTAVDTGRDGFGSIIVKAAGNGDTDASNEAISASPYAIVVSAYSSLGYLASYSNVGANILVAAPGSEFPINGGLGIVTTDRTGTDGYNLRADPTGSYNYTDDFGGTSAATPIVSGVIALMLDASESDGTRTLGWRDVQTILAYSASHVGGALGGSPIGFEVGTWQFNGATNWNNGGLHFHRSYGFGAVDAFAAVRMAEIWHLLPGEEQTSANDVVNTIVGTGATLPGGSTTDFTFNVTNDAVVEHVVIDLTMSTTYAGDYDIQVIAPDGTTVLAGDLFDVGNAIFVNNTFSLPVQSFRGISAAGTWTVRIIDTVSLDSGSIGAISLTIRGAAQDSNDVYHYTDEFADVLALNGTRGTLADTDGGSDWINAAAVTSNVELFLSAGQTVRFGGVDAFTIAAGTRLENGITGDGNDTLNGNATSNQLHAMRGNDSLYGNGGNDTLNGGQGNDNLWGGLGADAHIGGNGTADYARYDDANYGNLTISLDSPDQNTGAAAGDTFVGIEGVIGGLGNDIIVGNGQINDLVGGGGTDQIFGNGGSDVLQGGLGGDHLWGGTGSDQHIGGDDAGIDYARYDDAFYGDLIIRLDNAALNSGVATGDSYIGIEGLVGGAGNDTVVGNTGNNFLFGGGGVDLIYGGNGNDYLSGDNGGDNLWGGLGADQHIGGNDSGIDYARYDDANYGNLTIRLDFSSFNVGAAAVGDTYSGIEGLVGGAGNDIVVGNGNANFLFGSGGNDIFFGQAGNDYLHGGAGNDQFRFTTALNAMTNVDTIADFAINVDDIVLSQAIFTGIGGTLDAAEYTTGASATTAAHRIIYNAGGLFFDADGNGAGAAIRFATVGGSPVLTLTDFIMTV